MRVALLNDPNNECVRACEVLAAAGGLGASIGFEATNFGPPTPEEEAQYPETDTIIRNWKGLEVSFTGMPCNVACQSMAMIGGEDKTAHTREILTKGRFSEATIKRFGLPFSKPRRVIACYSR
jgi:hypothetical protein